MLVSSSVTSQVAKSLASPISLSVAAPVRFIKTNKTCDTSGGCCRGNGFKIGVVGEIYALPDERNGNYGITLIEKSDGSGSCVFPRECFERV